MIDNLFSPQMLITYIVLWEISTIANVLVYGCIYGYWKAYAIYALITTVICAVLALIVASSAGWLR